MMNEREKECLCVRVCVRKRERDRNGGDERVVFDNATHSSKNPPLVSHQSKGKHVTINCFINYYCLRTNEQTRTLN